MFRRSLATGLAPLLLALPAGAQDTPFLRVRIDEARNRALLEIPAAQLNKDFLHQVTIATGLGNGSLDRGSTGPNGIVRLERRGNRVLMVRDNWGVRTLTGDAVQQKAARDAFPRSIVGSFPIERDSSGVIVADASSLFLSDAYGVAENLRGAAPGAGAYRVDAARSYIDGERTKAFPRNVEVHAVITFVTDQGGRGGRGGLAPDPKAMTFEEHHSLVLLPDTAGFRPRIADPRYGYGTTPFADLTEPLSGDYRNAYVNRWRLVPKDPAAYARGELVEPVTPITYYLDPATPEPYKSAMKEGGNWWAKVFEGAGFKNAFRVLDLPAGADPMDARYSMLFWLHRNGPGPSVGSSYTDPRTGEIIRGMARMDAWRSLIDYNIWAGTVPAAGPNGPNVSADAFAMARRRQHSAHEIGHTLGLQHNYIASTQNRSSVMDYPFPFISVAKDGSLDLRDAYRTGPGAWDSLAINLGYHWFADAAKEKTGLAAIMKDGIARNVRFINDTYANSNTPNPFVTRWEEGATAFDAVQRTRAVRRVLIDKFDERAIQPGEPMALLNMRFTHAYLHHRYSLEALAKYVGGEDFSFALRGDGQVPTRMIAADEQRKALTLSLDAIQPAELTVPDRVQALIPPAPPGFNTDQIWADGYTGPTFDPVTLGGGLATEVIGYLLDRERAARVVVQASRDANQLTLDEVIGTILNRTWGAAAPTAAAERAMQRVAQRAALDVLLDLAGDAKAMPDVRAAAVHHLKALQARLGSMAGVDDAAKAHISAAVFDIQRFMDGNDKPELRPRYPVIVLPWP